MRLAKQCHIFLVGDVLYHLEFAQGGVAVHSAPRRLEQPVGAFEDVAVALNANEQFHLLGLTVNQVWLHALGVDGYAAIGKAVAQQRLVACVILPQARDGAINVAHDVLAVLAHERQFPVVLVLGLVFL